MDIEKIVDELNIYYDSLNENINSNTFNDYESSWMVETKLEFDDQFEQLKEHIKYINQDL